MYCQIDGLEEYNLKMTSEELATFLKDATSSEFHRICISACYCYAGSEPTTSNFKEKLENIANNFERKCKQHCRCYNPTAVQDANTLIDNSISA